MPEWPDEPLMMSGIFEDTVESNDNHTLTQDMYENNGTSDTCEPAAPTSSRGRGRKRNKPTLSCTACVGRKTKCDRARPTCVACYRRQSVCEYSALADIIAVTDALRSQRRGRKQKRKTPSNNLPPTAPTSCDWTSPQRLSNSEAFDGNQSLPSPPLIEDLSSEMMTSVPPPRHEQLSYEPPALFNLFGMTSQHPFRNLWTDAGGLTEVIAVLPTREEADVLVQKYFEITDPIYPIIAKDVFMGEYRKLWDASEEEKQLCDPAHLALQFAMYTIGVQYMDSRTSAERDTSSLFYLSCCHQCLCISSYLNQCTLVTLQTMVLITYYLVASHRVSDAWTFSGIAQRQAYSLQLHRDPTLAAPDVSSWQQQVHSRLWLATMFQDTSLSLYLELPPATMHYEIQPDCLKPFAESRQSTSVTQPWQDNPSPLASDIGYLRAMWQYTQFAQKYVCVNKSLKRSISNDPMHKKQLISQLRELYLNFDPPFNTYNHSRFDNQPERLARQLVSLSSNFFYGLTILCMDQSKDTGIECDVYGALDASHEAMASFFALARLFPGETDTWGAPQIRAYTQASMIAAILADFAKTTEHAPRDPHLMLANSNLDRYIDILVRAHGSYDFDAIHQKRLADLQSLRDRITAV